MSGNVLVVDHYHFCFGGHDHVLLVKKNEISIVKKDETNCSVADKLLNVHKRSFDMLL